MRTLHVIPYLHPSAGGPPVVVENVVRESNRLGHSSEIVSMPLFCKDDEAEWLGHFNNLAPTTFVARSQVISLLRSSARQRLSEAIYSSDIVHVHTIWNLLNFIVRQECVRHHRPYVLMPHGMLDPYSLTVKRWRKALYLRAIERRNILSARRIVYASEEEARLAQTSLASLPKGVVIPLGGDAPWERAKEFAAAFYKQFPKASGRRQLLFLGRLHFKKGVDRILAILPSIAARFPDVLLTIVGGGTCEFEVKLKQEIRGMGLQELVLMTGRLQGPAKWGAYASAELFLLPSRQENFAITVAEAMQMGIPVVISDKVNTWPYVRDAGAGVILEEDRIEGGLQHSVLSLLEGRQAQQEMSEGGRTYARQHLTWAGAAARLLRCYEEVLAEARVTNRIW